MRVVVIEGDGVGPEVISSALRVLKAAAAKYGLTVDLQFVEAG
ncbi:MAG: isocitrate/isopropylmalate family dehydrogenase, partial [Vulcanisaeta sp.]|nr:isocitrate/isopropylmalate family dehydrogenase [Vulcanisaeta sp.]